MDNQVLSYCFLHYIIERMYSSYLRKVLQGTGRVSVAIMADKKYYLLIIGLFLFTATLVHCEDEEGDAEKDAGK